MADMDEHKTSGAGNADGHGRGDRPLGRGLEDVSHLFLSQRLPEPERSSPPPAPRGGVALLRAASVSKERLAGVLREFAGALEDGLKPIDANIPCHPCGEIDLLATDRARQLTIIDFATSIDDGLLLRGIGHFDWVARNMPNVRRMCQGQIVDFSRQPRLVLLAPQFSPLLRSALRQLTRPRIHPVKYHTVEAAGCTGILFEPVEDE